LFGPDHRPESVRQSFVAMVPYFFVFLVFRNKVAYLPYEYE